MPDAPLPPPPVPPSPPSMLTAPSFRRPRTPPPGPVVWLAFLFGPSVLCAVGSVLTVLANGRTETDLLGDAAGAAFAGALGGLVLGVCGIAGLALATCFFRGMAGRIIGGLVLGMAFLVGLAAAAFAGCMCMLQSVSHS